MGQKIKIQKDQLQALLQLENTSYEGELQQLYQRLSDGKMKFEQIVEQTMNTLLMLSSFDLTIKHHTGNLVEITSDVVNATDSIYSAAQDSNDVAEAVSFQHEELTNTIIVASEQASDVYNKIEIGQEELTQVKELSDKTIDESEKLRSDMEQLSNVINKMNEVIGGINAISNQTNLLALNASIEAARAGEAGRGFAVVAEEITALANQTKDLTADMGKLVSNINTAAQNSVQSSSETITSMQTVVERLQNVWQYNHENQEHMAKITESISSLAAVSEEISSSMNELEARAQAIEESCQVLSKQTSNVKSLNDDLISLIEPIEQVEATLDGAAKIMGQMGHDPYFMLDRDEIAKYIDLAISAHQGWIQKLGQIVEEKMILPLQLDEHKCGLGHFYYSMHIAYPEVKEIWEEIGEKHITFHSYGKKVIDALFAEEYDNASAIYEEAVDFSKELIALFEKAKEILLGE